eukprot:768488-Hanusia_phi.AAC.3
MRPSSRSRGTPSALLSPSKERTGKPLWWQLRRTSMTLPTLSMVRRHLTGFAMMSETVQRLISQSGWCGRNRSERWRSEMSKTPSLVKVCATRLATITVVTMGSRKWTLDVHSTMMKTREMEVRWTPPSMAAAPASLDQLPEEPPDGGADQPAGHEVADRKRRAVGDKHEEEVEDGGDEERGVAEGLVRPSLRHHPDDALLLAAEEEGRQLVVLSLRTSQPHSELLGRIAGMALSSSPLAVSSPPARQPVVPSSYTHPSRRVHALGSQPDARAVVSGSPAPPAPVICFRAGPGAVVPADGVVGREEEDGVAGAERDEQHFEHLEVPRARPPRCQEVEACSEEPSQHASHRSEDDEQEQLPYVDGRVQRTHAVRSPVGVQCPLLGVSDRDRRPEGEQPRQADVSSRPISCGDRCDAASSKANRTPPIGAPNAAAMPAPAPAAMNSRRSLSLWNCASPEWGSQGRNV